MFFLLKVDFGNFCQNMEVIQNRVNLILMVFYHMSLCQLFHFFTYLLVQVGNSKSFCTIYCIDVWGQTFHQCSIS